MNTNDIINIAREYATNCHDSTNHKYDKTKPYSVHLQMAYEFGWKFIHIIPIDHRDDVLAAIWCHDLIEDCRQTYNDVKKSTNEQVANLVYAVTNEKGKNRKERANNKYYKGIRMTPYATFVKLCDRLANYKYSIDTKSSMADSYADEMEEFLAGLWDGTSYYMEMFDALKDLKYKEHTDLGCQLCKGVNSDQCIACNP